MVDADKMIRMAVDTGETKLGVEEAKKALINKRTKMVIIANNCPEGNLKDLKYLSKLSGIPYYQYGGTSKDLGVLCGKPYFISAMAIVKEGNSEIMQLVEK